MKKMILLFILLTFFSLGFYFYWREGQELVDSSQVISSIDEEDGENIKRGPSSITLRFADSVADSKCGSVKCLAYAPKEDEVIPENEEEDLPEVEANVLCDKEDVSSECTYVCGSDQGKETGALVKQEEESEQGDACECSNPNAKWNPTINRCAGGDVGRKEDS